LRLRMTSSLPGTSSICHDTSHMLRSMTKEKKKSKHTVQIPALLSSLRDSRSSSIAPSFSYASSSETFVDRAPSAASAQAQACQGKKKAMP
jgi:hypothetical protein